MAGSATGVLIVGGGISGLACARRLHAEGMAFTLLEAEDRVGGRIKTDRVDGFRLDRGFQVLQTAYPEARHALDYPQLDLHSFAPGAMIRVRGRFYTVADPLRQPKHLLETLTAPIGTFGDRLRLIRLARRVTDSRLEDLFLQPETTAMDFLRAEGFTDAMIERFFVPFFGGVCLDPRIRASSRVLQYVLRMFAAGDAAVPSMGMEEIPLQLARNLSPGSVRTGVRVRHVSGKRVILDDGTSLSPRAIVLATEAPETRRLLELPQTTGSVSETCLYFSCDRADRHPPFLMLNGDGNGPINNIAIPSQVSPAYAPPGKSLISIVVLGMAEKDDDRLYSRVKTQLVDWFGGEGAGWEHLATYRISHALPEQSPPTEDPTVPTRMVRPGLFVAGEHGRLPGIQWALHSGRRAAEAVLHYSEKNREPDRG